MDKLFEYLAKEWLVISQAPFAFLILATLMFGLAYMAVRWKYSSVIEQVRASNETLKERILQKSEQMESYKERALKYDQRLLEVVDSDAVNLKEKTMELVGNIREFVTRFKRQDEIVRENEWFEMTEAKTEDEKARLWNKFISASSRLSSELHAEYDRRFKVDSLMLRDELRSRLIDYKPDDRIDHSYEHPTNYFGFNDVAADLEKMAKLLPIANKQPNQA